MNNHKTLLVTVLVLTVSFQSCKKKEEETTETPPVNTSKDYYAKLTYGGKTYEFDGDRFQVGNSGDHEMGGFVPKSSIFAGGSFGITIRLDTSVKATDLQSVLVGKKIYFNDYDGPYPTVMSITHEVDLTSPFIWSVDDPGSAYYVELSSISDLGNDNTKTWHKYEARGTFKVKMEVETGVYQDGSGEFFMQWSTDAF